MIHDVYQSSEPGLIRRAALINVLRRHADAVATSGAGRLIAMRGRRQVGKSTLTEQFVREVGLPHVFVSGVYQAPLAQQLADATTALLESSRPLPDADLLAGTPARSWREWLGRLALAARSGPIVVVLDEFPWLLAGDRALEGELQRQWDRDLGRLPVLLLVVGSDVAMMDSLAGHGRPLFGRVTPMVVPALDPGEVATVMPSGPAAFDAHLVTGGYPRLLADLVATGADDVVGYVRVALSDPYSPLVTTARLTLESEFPEPQAAYQVLSALGASDRSASVFTDVLGALLGDATDPAERKRVETATTRALSVLGETKGLIEREQPAWAPPASRLRRYRVSDPYLRFWFRYVERQVDRIARGRADLAIAAFERDWASWRGQAIEPVVRESVLRLAAHDERLADVEVVAPWWTRDGSVEVDVVAASARESLLVGTVKWRERAGVGVRDVEQLRAHRERVPRAAAARLLSVARQGPAPDGVDLHLTADHLIAAWAPTPTS